jgi:hypothetical protein
MPKPYRGAGFNNRIGPFSLDKVPTNSNISCGSFLMSRF